VKNIDCVNSRVFRKGTRVEGTCRCLKSVGPCHTCKLSKVGFTTQQVCIKCKGGTFFHQGACLERCPDGLAETGTHKDANRKCTYRQGWRGFPVSHDAEYHVLTIKRAAHHAPTLPCLALLFLALPCFSMPCFVSPCLNLSCLVWRRFGSACLPRWQDAGERWQSLTRREKLPLPRQGETNFCFATPFTNHGDHVYHFRLHAELLYCYCDCSFHSTSRLKLLLQNCHWCQFDGVASGSRSGEKCTRCTNRTYLEDDRCGFACNDPDLIPYGTARRGKQNSCWHVCHTHGLISQLG